MSLILDALNKSEQDRPAKDVTPGLQTIHHTAPQEQRRWLWVVWPVATVIFAALALGLWMGRAADAPRPEAPFVSTAVTAPAPVPLAEPVLAVQEAVLEAPQPEVLEVLPEPTVVITEPVSTIDDSVAALYAPVVKQPVPNPQQKPAPVVEDTATAIDIDALAQAAEQALAERLAVEHNVPFISELRQSTKDEIPTVFFTVHRWSSSPQDKDVVLNGKTYHEGDLVKPGLRLTEILKDSIVLDYRGTEFRLNSLNSWVNL